MNRLESVRNVHLPFSLTSISCNRAEPRAPKHTHIIPKFGLV